MEPAAKGAQLTAMSEEQHHSTEEDLRQHRLDKLERIRARGDEPFKYIFERSATIADARAAFEELENAAFEEQENAAEDKAGVQIAAVLAGRVVAFRDHGKTASSRIFATKAWRACRSISIRRQLGEAAFARIERPGPRRFHWRQWHRETHTHRRDHDLRRFVYPAYKIATRVAGKISRSDGRGNALPPALPRLVANPEVLDTFRKRIKLIDTMRSWLTARGFLEVETPMLHPIPGGASARPFITHHNTYDCDLYMRIAPELYLKRLIVGGFERVFEINRNFRNEGVDTRHNPEFTMMELYEAYQDYLGLMDETEELFCAIIEAVNGGPEFEYQGTVINATRPWKRLALFDAIKEYAGIDLTVTRDRDEAAKLAKSAGVKIDNTMGYGKIVDEVMSACVKPRLVQPTFLYDYPVEISPLAKKHRDNPAITERFQAFIGTLELCNAFSELNDPIDQRDRFMQQGKERERGDEEAQHLDEDFITALEIGMPPTAGLGIGIDRLAMLLTNSGSIRDVILFPQLRPTE